MIRVLAAAGLVALVVAGASLARPAAAPTLRGTVGPGFTITLKKDGHKVTKLKAGTYRFVVADRSSAHNFTLEKEKGGKFERELTDVSDTGTRTATIKLSAGKYKYYCEPHESSMFGTFTVS